MEWTWLRFRYLSRGLGGDQSGFTFAYLSAWFGIDGKGQHRALDKVELDELLFGQEDEGVIASGIASS